MAEAWGGQITTSSGNWWRAGVRVSTNWQTSDATSLRVELLVQTRWSFNVYANGSVWANDTDIAAGGTSASFSGSLSQGSTGQGATRVYAAFDVQYSHRYGSSRTVSFGGSYTVTGGYGNGTSSASVSVSLPARPYSAPRPPASPSVTRASDTRQVVSWRSNYDSSSGAQPWSGVRVYRSVDGGGYALAATLGWDATSWADTSTSAHHRYSYQLESYNQAGSSQRVTAGTVYTTPSAPTGCSVARWSDSSQRLSWSRGANAAATWSGVRVYRSVDGGAWALLGTASAGATSYTDNATSANHRYSYQLASYNAAGESPRASAGTVYTTPSAPTGCSVARVSDSSQRVTWRRGANADDTWQGAYVDRSTDGGGWVQVASVAASATSYTDNSTSAGHMYRYAVRSRNAQATSARVEAGTVYTTPTPPTSVTARVVSGTTVSVKASGYGAYATAFDVERSVAGGEWRRVATDAQLPVTDDVSGTARWRVRAKRGSLASAWATSGSITTIVAPLAPTVAVSPQVVALGDALSVSWVPNHPDGSAQTSAQVELTPPSGDATVIDVEGAARRATVPAASLAAVGPYSVRVRTHGADEDWGAWSGPVALSVARRPEVTITDPATDDATEVAVPVTIAWEVRDETGVSGQTLRVLSSGGDELHRATLPGDARAYSLGSQTYLPQNGASYVVEVTATGGSSLAATASRHFSTMWMPPAVPSVDAEPSARDLSVSLTPHVGNNGPWWYVEGTTLMGTVTGATVEEVPLGADGSVADGVLDLPENPEEGAPASGWLTVARVGEGGTLTPVGGRLADGMTVIDRLPPLNREVTYRVTSHVESGEASDSEVTVRTGSDGAEAYNFGQAAEDAVLLRFDAESSESVEHSGEAFHFALGPDAEDLPTFYPDGDVDVTGSRSYALNSLADYLRLREITRRRTSAMCWYRDHWGNRAYGTAAITLSYSAARHGLWEVSVSFMECVWEEPVNA